VKAYFAAAKRTVEEITVKRSRFIAEVFPIGSAEDAEYSINGIKREYYDATHHCYAYIADPNTFRFSDDGEPQGTAGLPMLSVLKKREFAYTAAVVTRYFGGIKLGAAGLVSAYTDALLYALEHAEIARYSYCALFKITFLYTQCKTVDGVLREHSATTQHAEYAERVSYTVYIEEERKNTLKNALIENTSGNVTIEECGEGFFKVES
jgi:uncharacterized YigZ family protein